MSTIEAKIIKITNIKSHPNADKLEIVLPNGEGGFECVVGLGQFSENDLAIYIMPDSVITEEMSATLMERSKIQIKNGRIRPIKIRNILSEGLCLNPEEWLNHPVQEDDDVTEELGITKYEPPPRSSSSLRSGKGINFNYKNENFKEYYCVEKFKKCPKVLAELNPEVVATIKYHGTNFRCGWVKKPEYKKTWWQKFISLFVKKNPQEFLVGSHNKIKFPTKDALKNGDYYNTDTWWRAAKKYDLESVTKQIVDHEAMLHPDKDPPNVMLFAEVVGPGIQKGYDYGISAGEIEIRVFDIMIGGNYADWDTVVHLCNCFNLPVVDEVYRGPWHLDVTKKAAAIDIYNGKKYVREGVVIRSIKEAWHPKCGRVIFKYLNEAYLLDKTNSDYH